MSLDAKQLQELKDRTEEQHAVIDPDKLELEPVAEQKPIQDEPDEVEAAAREEGWVPLEEWNGDPKDWVEAKEFVFRGELMGRIKKQSKVINNFKSEIDEMKTALRELGEHNRKIAENERKKALAELRKAKKEAFEDNDFEALEEIDERMDELKSVDLSKGDNKEAPPKEDATQNSVDPEVEVWLTKNDWYTKDPLLQGMTNGAIQQLVQKDPDLENDPSALLEKAKRIVMKEMPHKFEEEQQSPRGSVAEPQTRSRAGQGNKKSLAKYLSPMQKKVAQTFVRSGAIASEEEYAKQLDELGELEY